MWERPSLPGAAETSGRSTLPVCRREGAFADFFLHLGDLQFPPLRDAPVAHCFDLCLLRLTAVIPGLRQAIRDYPV